MTALIVTPSNGLPLHPEYVTLAGRQLNNGDRQLARPNGTLWQRQSDQARDAGPAL